MTNPALESALPTQVNFTQKEWAAFGIAHLHYNDYIMSKINNVVQYFQPAASKFDHWAYKSDASEEYKQMTLRTFQMAPQSVCSRERMHNKFNLFVALLSLANPRPSVIPRLLRLAACVLDWSTLPSRLLSALSFLGSLR